MIRFTARVNDILRWLLRVDVPVPRRSEAEIQAEQDRNYRWNFTVNLLDGASFWFGASFISATTVLPLFVNKLSHHPFPLALLAIIGQSSWFLPQLFTANQVERLARKKPVVVNLGFFLERLPVWGMVGAALLAPISPLAALLIFLFAYAVHGFGAGIIATAWQDLLARIFPVDRRGRFFGLTMFLGALAALAGAYLTTWVLETFAFPNNFSYLFLIAAAAITISWAFLALAREPVRPIETPRRSNRQFWSDLPRILDRDHNFRRFLIARLLLTLGAMGTGFVTVAAVQRWQISDGTVGLYTAAHLFGQTLGNLALGFLADRFGHKLSLEIAGLAACLAFALAWLAPDPVWYYPVFALLGISYGAIILSGILVVLEFCRPERRPTYTGMANTGSGLVAIVAPLLGATLAGIDYNWLFATSAGVSLLSMIFMRWWVHEPRWAGVVNEIEL